MFKLKRLPPCVVIITHFAEPSASCLTINNTPIESEHWLADILIYHSGSAINAYIA